LAPIKAEQPSSASGTTKCTESGAQARLDCARLADHERPAEFESLGKVPIEDIGADASDLLSSGSAHFLPMER
jgi:hypothetical protein